MLSTMPRDFFPRKDASALDWSRNFRDRLLLHPQHYFFTPQQVADFSQLHDDFAVKFQRTRDPGTATRPATRAKNDARRALEKMIRSMATQLRGRKEIPASEKVLLGVKQRRSGQSRTPRPGRAPGIMVLRGPGHAMTLHLMDMPAGICRVPDNVSGATVRYHVGETAPAGSTGWTFPRQTSRSRVTIALPSSVPPGARLWVTACWYNRRGEQGPDAVAVSAAA